MDKQGLEWEDLVGRGKEERLEEGNMRKDS